MFYKLNTYNTLFFLSFVIVILTSLPVALADSTCIDCHEDEKFRVQNKVIFDYFNSWKNSVHEISGITCTDCHGGDATKRGKSEAHRYDFSSLTFAEEGSYKNIPGICGKCHEAIYRTFTKSKHYTALLNKGTGPHCATCHGSMNADVYYTNIVVRACQQCHNEYTDNRPEVAGKANKILHRINVSRSFRNWISLHYSGAEEETVKEINELYKNISESWHTFDFAKLDEQSLHLLNKAKSIVNRELRKKKKQKGSSY